MVSTLCDNNDMKNMKNNLGQLISASVCAAVVGLAAQANALTYNLYSSSAKLDDGNKNSLFYEAHPADGSTAAHELGTAKDLYSFASGGSATKGGTGLWEEISFGTQPQPVLTSAFLKAGNYFLLWDSADLIAFNAGTFTSITLWNNRILNPPKNSYLGTSHTGLVGTLGVTPPIDPPATPVPDAGSTLMLLGAGLTGVGLLRRRVGC
jgi:hypothetical protein